VAGRRGGEDRAGPCRRSIHGHGGIEAGDQTDRQQPSEAKEIRGCEGGNREMGKRGGYPSLPAFSEGSGRDLLRVLSRVCSQQLHSGTTLPSFRSNLARSSSLH